MKTINLHCYTAKGSLESMIDVDELIQIDSPIVSIINPYMFNTIEFYRECKNIGKIPIIGLDAYTSFGKVSNLLMYGPHMYGRLSLIAMNRDGYNNLVKLSSFGFIEGLYNKPRIDYNVLEENNKGLLCLINSVQSNAALYYSNKDSDLANRDITWLKTMFGDRLYIELYDNAKADSEFVKLCNQFDIKSIPSNEVFFLNKEDYVAFRYLWAINNNVNVSEVPDFSEYYYKDTFSQQLNDFLPNLYELINRIDDYGLDKGDNSIPNSGIDPETLPSMLFERMEQKQLMSGPYIERLNHELYVIQQFGYENYFLLIYDLIKYCNNELSGYYSAGRGSVGGCLVAYLLGITRIDPVNPVGFDMQVPFDRFLNEGRKVMPDIDLDFLPDDRPKIIQYLNDKYGENYVKNITTTVTLGPRSSLREVCRVSGQLTPEMENIIKSFPNDQQLSLSMVKESDIYIKNINNIIFTTMFDIAEKLEGIPRSIGIHASGIALSCNDMTNIVPMFIHNSGKMATQYDQEQLEYLGIMKLDILGLNTLQIVNEALSIIDPSLTAEHKIIFLNTIRTDDVQVYDFINSTYIEGVFQWDTYNYKKVIRQVNPKNFKELVDLNTLGRSAALLSGLTDKYIRRKLEIEEVTPLHPMLEGLMSTTYGLPLYQEQIMELFVKLADYSLSEADDVRKAIGKKLPELMQKQKNKFIERCKGGEIVANELWEIINKFSKYTWNLGHALTYTKLCYETAYLASHYPEAFYCACINNAGDAKEAGHFVSTLKKRGIEILPVSINNSDIKYKVVSKGTILAGFTGLKYLTDKTIKNLIEIRSNGFISMSHFDSLVPKKLINKTAMISLYCSGALNELLDEEDVFFKRIGDSDTLSLLIDQYNKCGRVCVDVRPILDGEFQTIKDLAYNSQVRIPAYIVAIKEIYTKKGERMAFLEIEDIDGRYELTVFPSTWSNVKIKVGNPYIMLLSYGSGIICNGIIDFMSDSIVSN